MKSSKGFSLIEVITALAVVSILLPVVGIVFYNLFVIPPDKVARLNLNNELALLSSFLYNDAHIADNFSAGDSPYYGNFTWIDYTTGNHYIVSYYATCPDTSNTSCNNQIIRHVTRENFSESSPTPTPTPTSTPTPPPTPTPTAVPDIETYTYCTGVSGSAQNKWAWAKAWNNSEWFTLGRPTTDSNFFEASNRSEINAYPSDYVALCAADNSSWGNTDTTPPLDYAADSQLYTININQVRDSITGLSLTWTGYGGAFTQNTTVKMWDHVGGGHWDTFISLSDPGNKNIATYVYNVSGVGTKNYVQPADLNVHILVSSDNGDMAPEDTNFGDALYFNGSNSSTVTANCSAAPTDTFTFEAWVKATETHDIDTESTSGTSGDSGQHYVFYPPDGGASNAGVGLSVGTNGISVYENGSGYMPAVAVYSGSLGTAWNHIAVVYSSNVAKIYLNGDLVETGNTSTKGTAYAPCAIGGGSYGYFSGTIDEVRLWNVALTEEQIRDNMYKEDPTASGGTTTVVYNSSDSFTPPAGITSVQVLVVGGGGGGGGAYTGATYFNAGGGGGGGVVYNASYPVTPLSPVTVTVGTGGAGGVGYSNGSTYPGDNGLNSSFGSITAYGGGGGGGGHASNISISYGRNGSSGGGAGVYWATNIRGSYGTSGQGNNGGWSYFSLSVPAGGGGGGAGAVGGNASWNGSWTLGGTGGSGSNYSATFGAVGGAGGWFGGGGGGGVQDNIYTPTLKGAGGQGGGGAGGDSTDGVAGTANTGGGGGGAGTHATNQGGSGGSGIVVIKYTGATTSPVGYWKFNDCSTDVGDGKMEDSSTNNNDGTLSSPAPQCAASLDRELTVYTDYIALTVTSGSGPTPTPTIEPKPTPVPTQVAFTSSTTWTVPDGITSIDDILVVAGGGGGGSGQDMFNYCGGGGGGGGFIYNASYGAVTPGANITVTVGPGGAGGTGNNAGTNGSNSVFGSITATGGGGGGNTAGKAGGSGGGGGATTSSYSGGSGTAGPPLQGYAGGASNYSTKPGWGPGYNYRQSLNISNSISGYCNSGGTVTTVGEYTIHTFTTVGDNCFVAGAAGNVDILVVGGGGSGGGAYPAYSSAGGGGGGGVIYSTGYSITAGTHSVVVGDGGAGEYGHSGLNGGDSSFGSQIAYGGGGGGEQENGLNGASGGGAASYMGTYDHGIASHGSQGYAGGHAYWAGLYWHRAAAGGGGGAGGVGTNAGSDDGGEGGPGYACSISGASVTYAGGGGGGVYDGTRGGGGAGGGGNGGDSSDGNNGTDGLGGGGGGAGCWASSVRGGDGGSGIVIVRCKTSDFSCPALTNYQMKLTVSNASGTSSGSTVYLNGSSLSWPYDIRFTKSDGSTLLDYWIETYDSTTATVWVEFDSIPAGGTTQFYIYYSKASDTDGSNGDNTFIFFDDFNDNSINGSKWTTVSGGGGSIAETGQEIRVTSAGLNRIYLRSQSSFSAPYILDLMAKRSENIEVAIHWDGTVSGTYDQPVNGYLAPQYVGWSGTNLLLYRYVSGSQTQLDVYSISLDANYHNYSTVAKSCTGIDVYYDNSLILDTTDRTRQSGYIGLSARETPSAANAYYDNVRIRKYASTAPTWGTWGSVECSTEPAAGGGGGAGAAGANATSGVGGNGGAGVSQSATFGFGVGASGWFAGGGGGGSGFTPGSGGTGGGGAGGKTTNGGAGTANTGGGGGGTTGSSRTGGAGGSGVVIIQYGAPFFTLLTSAGAGGNVTTPAPPGANYLAGTIASIVAVPDQCYIFANWSGTGVDAGKVADPSAASTNITMSADYNVQANFTFSTSNNSLSLTADPVGGGEPYFIGSSPFTCGTNVSIFADTNEDWTFDGWTPTDGIADANASDTTVLMTANRSLTAHYTEGTPQGPTPTPIYYLTSMALTRFVTADNFSLNESGGLILASMTACTNTSMGKFVEKQLTIYLMQRPLYLLPEESIWGEDTVSALDTLRFSGTHNSISGNVKVNGTVTVAATAAANDIDGTLTCHEISWLPDPPGTVNLSKLDYTQIVTTEYVNNSMPVLWPAQQYFTTNLSLGIQVLNDSIREYVFTGDVDLHSVNGVWVDNSSSSQTLKTGIYYSPGTITLADTYTKGQVTFIANRIIINNNDTGGLITPVIMLVPYREELLFWANGSLGSTTTDYDGAILIRGISDWHACVNLEGVLYAPNGEIELAGSGRTGWFGYTEPASIYGSALVGKDLSIGNSVAGSGSYWNFYRY
ncbi:MAG: DUF2341 domain-containing protein [Dehalococcoidia bacterium]|jgi:hypothetical protein